MITNKQAIKLLRQWKINWTQEYRGFVCAGCGKTMGKAWHIHCIEWWFRREIHLCRKCYEKYSI